MRIFVAGATGVIGRELVAQLNRGGHEVTGMTRSESRADGIRALGAEAAVADALDADALSAAVAAAGPEVVIGQLTSLPSDFGASADFGPTNRLRREGGRNLARAAAAAGARRLITQSIAFLYAPADPPLCREDAPAFHDAPDGLREVVEAALDGERETLEADVPTRAALRYGWLYGPGTYYARDGGIAREVRRRRFPVVGGGGGVNSFLHVSDAASATVALAESDAEGVFNVCDDEPARVADWLPEYARAIGAKPPRRVPAWLAKPAAGALGIHFMTTQPGADNARIRREVGWSPRFASWREGFREGLG